MTVDMSKPIKDYYVTFEFSERAVFSVKAFCKEDAKIIAESQLKKELYDYILDVEIEDI